MRAFVLACAALAGALAPSLARAGCEEAAAYSQDRAGLALIIVKDGRVVCERYAPHWGPQRAIELQSITKSFTSLIAAAAVQDGVLSLDDRASNTLMEWRDDPVKDQITVRELLDLSSGLTVNFGAGVVPTYAQAIAAPMKAVPGQRFEYGAGPFQVFGALVSRALTLSLQDPSPAAYLQRRVFDPIGVRPDSWTHLSDRMPTLSSGAHMTARDVARIGEFVRAGGMWDGVQLIDRETLDASFVRSSTNRNYGMAWWTIGTGGLSRGAPLPAGGYAQHAPSDWVMAAGAGKQRLLISREAGLTIVRLAPREGARGWSDREFLSILLDAPAAVPQRSTASAGAASAREAGA
jgi:CubicO group peptidase (beta-lactamase class C family)